MKKAFEKGPAQRMSFLNNYRALIIVVGFLLSSMCTHAQFYDSTKLLQYIQAYGYSWKNAEFRGSLIVARDTPKLAIKDSGAVAFSHGKFWGNNGYGWGALANADDIIPSWSLTGNASTNPATNFIGTTDNQNLVFKTNNTSRAIFNTSGALLMNTSGAQIELNNSVGDTYLKMGNQSGRYIQLHDNSTGYFRIEYNDVPNVITRYPFIMGSTGLISLGSDPSIATSGFYIDPFTSGTGVVANTPYISGAGNGSSLNIGANNGGSSGGIVRMLSKNSGGLRSILEYTDNTATSTSDLLLQKAGGKVGIGTTSPTEELHIVGDLKLVNGSQADGNILKSDVNGVTSFTSRFVKNLNTNTTQVGNVGIGLDDLITYTIPANTLSTNGDYIEFYMHFIFAGNANSKEIILFIGGTDFYTTGDDVQNGGGLLLKGTIVRTASNTQSIFIEQLGSQGAVYPTQSEYSYGSEDLTTGLVIKATGAGDNDDDIIQDLMIIKYFPSN